MRKLILILSLFFACGHCFAFGDGGGVKFGKLRFKTGVHRLDPDPEPVADFKTLIVPIKRVGNLIVVEAQVDSLEGNFVFDTGAPNLVLNETYFRYYPKIEEHEVGGINGPTGGFTTYVHNFKILDLQFSRLTADVTDLSPIENSRHIKVLGLLGTRLFAKFSVTVDLFKNVLYIQKTEKDGSVAEGEKIFHDRMLVSPFKYLNDVIFLRTEVNGSAFWFAFDSAAETNLLDYDRMKKVVRTMQVISRSKIAGVGGLGFEVLYVKFDQITVGGHTFSPNRAIVTNLEKMGRAYNNSIDGILGYDFFSHGIFTINFVKKEFEMYIYNN